LVGAHHLQHACSTRLSIHPEKDFVFAVAIQVAYKQCAAAAMSNELLPEAFGETIPTLSKDDNRNIPSILIMFLPCTGSSGFAHQRNQAALPG
jgi:hypothetical protein